MPGRIFVGALLLFVAVFGAALFWFQTYAYYERVTGLGSIAVSGREIPVRDYQGIDATSSGLKLRGCFTADPAAFDGLPRAEAAEPLTPPFWFDCFPTDRLAHDLQAGTATAYLAATEEFDGIDRIVAVYPDGRAFQWRQLNERFAN
ncbi:histidine kinase [Rhodobacteraceae bacterium 2CG4]|uniref:Histidine kinase n=1 Tax=Halovulum marinum TaxID=2662447 RepID=A0A6L5Z0T3_9RHOB|nr:DUF6446 family protein [Halovulum marinum]MSU90098.1 histidine kinase [Halovulum marinum]